MMSALNTIVHVESRNLFCNARKISATPASPAWVATRMCSTYFALGGASCFHEINEIDSRAVKGRLLALILVPPFTDFSNEPDMARAVQLKSRRIHRNGVQWILQGAVCDPLMVSEWSPVQNRRFDDHGVEIELDVLGRST